MRTRTLRVLILVTAVAVTITLLGWQAPPSPSPPAAPEPQGAHQTPGTNHQAANEPAATAPAPAVRDLEHLSPLQKQLLFSAQRGADWMFRMNGIKGRFLYGYLPALQAEMEGDHYLRQVGAAFALARSARVLGEDRYAVRATQAVLALLEETALDEHDPSVRYCTLPPAVVNRLAAAGLLVLAINELPAPQADLLEKSEQLCNYIRRCARPDGSLALALPQDTSPKRERGDNDTSPKRERGDPGAGDDQEEVNFSPGVALSGLVCSQKHRPAAWKDELLVKAVAFYRPWWKAHRNMAFVPWQSAACTGAFLRTHDSKLAEFVLEMNDWMCQLQYTQIDPRHMLWYGGFMSSVDGQPVESTPQIGSAAYAEGLVEACRVARERGDVGRHQRYLETLERTLQFLTTLQYTDANTQHFAEWYRPRLAGAFHASHQDGNLRIDYTQHAVSALVGYLEHVAR
jgi:hypothetical protein